MWEMFSIFLMLFSSSHKAFVPVYSSRFSIFSNPKHCKYRLSFKRGVVYCCRSLHADNTLCAMYVHTLTVSASHVRNQMKAGQKIDLFRHTHGVAIALLGNLPR